MKYEVVGFNGPTLEYENTDNRITVSLGEGNVYGYNTANLTIRVTEVGKIGQEIKTSVVLTRPEPRATGNILFVAGTSNILVSETGEVGGNSVDGEIIKVEMYDPNMADQSFPKLYKATNINVSGGVRRFTYAIKLSPGSRTSYKSVRFIDTTNGNTSSIMVVTDHRDWDYDDSNPNYTIASVTYAAAGATGARTYVAGRIYELRFA